MPTPSAKTRRTATSNGLYRFLFLAGDYVGRRGYWCLSPLKTPFRLLHLSSGFFPVMRAGLEQGSESVHVASRWSPFGRRSRCGCGRVFWFVGTGSLFYLVYQTHTSAKSQRLCMRGKKGVYIFKFGAIRSSATSNTALVPHAHPEEAHGSVIKLDPHRDRSC